MNFFSSIGSTEKTPITHRKVGGSSASAEDPPEIHSLGEEKDTSSGDVSEYVMPVSGKQISRALKSIGAAFPSSPSIVTTVITTHKLRWLVLDGSSKIFVSASNFGFHFSLDASTVHNLTTSFKIKKVTVYGSIDPDSTSVVGIATPTIDWVDARTPAVSRSGMTTPGVPMKVSSTPPRNSFAGMWVYQDYNATSSIFTVSFPVAFNGVLEVDCMMTMLDQSHVGGTKAVANPGAGMMFQSNFAQSTILALGYNQLAI